MGLEELLPDTSRKTADLAVDFLQRSPEHIPEMIELSFSKNHLMAMRASRVIWLIGKHTPELLEVYLENIALSFNQLKDSSAIRNFLNLYIGKLDKLSEDALGILIDKAFKILENPNSKIAPRALSLDLLYESSQNFPDIKPVLKNIIELQVDESSTAYLSKARKIMKKLNKEVID